MSSALVFSSKATAQADGTAGAITALPQVIAIAGNATVGSLGAFTDRIVPYFYMGTSDPGRPDTFKVKITTSPTTSNDAWYGVRGRECTPEMFGDVTTNAAQCIQSAIDYLHSGGVGENKGGIIYLDARTYDLGTNTLFMRPNIQLLGVGRGQRIKPVTRLLSAITNGVPAITSADPTALNDNIVIENIDFVATHGAVTLIDAAGWGSSTIRRNGFYNMSDSGIGLYLRAGMVVKNIAGINKASAAVVQATGHGFSSNQLILIRGVGGMTQINGLWSKITVISANEFRLDNINSNDFSDYTSGGRAELWQGDATYNVVEQNYFGAGSHGIVIEDDASSNNIVYNRFQPGANCRGLTVQSHFGGFPNQINVMGNQFESPAAGAIGVHCDSGADFVVMNMNRFEFSGLGHIGIDATPGAGRLRSRDNYYEGTGGTFAGAGGRFAE